MSFLHESAAPPVVVYQLTERQMEELVERIAERVTRGPRPDAVRVPEAARLLGVSAKSLLRRIEAKQVRTLPDLGPKRISMEEIDRLNGIAAAKKARR